MNELHHACQAGDLARVEELLSGGTYDLEEAVEGESFVGRTALMLAARAGHVAVVSRLLRAGASIAAVGSDGFQAIHLAAYSGHAGVVEVLLAEGADPNAKDNYRFTPLHNACLGGSLEVVRLLIDAGADVNAQAKNGGTPLILASQYGHFDIIAALLEAGAAINLKENQGRSALYYAVLRTGDAALRAATLLVKCGARTDKMIQLPQMCVAVIAAGYPDWSVIPSPCPGLQQAVLAVWRRPTSSDDLPQLFKRLQSDVQERVRTVLLSLHRCCSELEQNLEEKLRIEILQASL